MDFVTELTERIRRLIGLETSLGGDYSFFQPGGNEHTVQFFFKNLPAEYLDLGMWDRNNLFLCELSVSLDHEFNLDDDGRFATQVTVNGKGVKSVQAVMDLRDDYIVTVYYYGESKACLKLNQQLMDAAHLSPCYTGMNFLDRLVEYLEKITRIDFEFEQYPSMFNDPVCLKGSFYGSPAHRIYHEYLETMPAYFAADCIWGRITDGTQGEMKFYSQGMLQVDDCRLSAFMEFVDRMHGMLREKYRNLVESCLLSWQSSSNGSAGRLSGSFIETWLQNPLSNSEGLVRYLVRGDKTNPFFGIAERISRKLWSVKMIEPESQSALEFEISANLVRIFLKQKGSIPLLNKLEEFLRKHVAANLEGFVC